jgi:N-acetylmuramoyl-L-alanine amidase
MRKFLSLSMAVVTITTIGTIGAFRPVTAIDFGQQEVDQNRFVAVAVPHIGSSPHLVIIEQISDSQPCWKESGTNPVTVDPLLLKFDFAGICRRGTDSNGYSIRMADHDLDMQYKLKLVRQNDELVLVGISNTDPNGSVLEIGKTHGISSGLTKIVLEPGWRFTKRTFNAQVLGHVYLTSDSALTNSHSEQQGIGAIPVHTTREMSSFNRKKDPTASAGQQTSSPSTPGRYMTAPTSYPPSSMNSLILFTGNPTQPVSPVISAQISAALAAKGLTLASCSANPRVVIMMGSYMACAYPTDIYPAGRYSLTF